MSQLPTAVHGDKKRLAKIKDREQAISAILNQSGLLPAGVHAQVEILAGNKRKLARKKPGTADAARFGPQDSFFVHFAAAAAEPGAAEPHTTEPIEELLRALQRAEQVPDHAFVALKWFRDTFLPKCAGAWAQDSAQRHHWLREAINRRWITTDRLANPRNPEFPTTAIRINRALWPPAWCCTCTCAARRRFSSAPTKPSRKRLGASGSRAGTRRRVSIADSSL